MSSMNFICACLFFCITASAQTDQIRLIRSQSGASGAVVGNRFVFEEIRTRFVYPQDKSLVVYFEWDAPPGEHLLTGIWKGPDGRPLSVSDDVKLQTPNRELHAYWKFELSSSMASGVWTLEIRADGQPAGTHVFEVSVPQPVPVTASTNAAPAPLTTQPVVPSLEEIYRNALRSMVWVHKIDDAGRRVDTGSGFIIGKDRVATAFQNIDGSSALDVEFSDGRSVKTTEVWSANRQQDWALIKADTQNLAALERDTAQNSFIGERLIAINVETNAVRSIGGVDVTGRQDLPNFPGRILISPALTAEAAGGPLMTSFGKVAGIIGGNLIPGARFERRTAALNLSLWTIFVPAAAATPVKLFPESAEPPVTLAALRSSGVFSAPLFPQPSFSYGGTTNSVPRNADAPIPRDVREFSRKDPAVWIYTWWQKRDKQSKGGISAKIYDAGNRMRGQVSPIKANLQDAPTRFAFSFPPTNLERGTYRVDVIWEDQAVWRTFFTIID